MLCITGFFYAVHNDTAVLEKNRAFRGNRPKKDLKVSESPLTSTHDMFNTLGNSMFLKLFMKMGLRLRILH